MTHSNLHTELQNELSETRRSCQDDWASIHTLVPETLYHYTSPTGLLGILRSKRLWATNVDFLNDKSELDYACGVIGHTISHFIEEHSGISSTLVSFLKEYDIFRDPDSSSFYIVCFCADGDLLSQWRGYGSAGGGYSIGFDSSLIRNVLSKNRGDLCRVIYDKHEQVHIINELLGKAVRYHSRFSAKDAKGQYQNMTRWCIAATVENISRCVYIFKHPAFREEKEWRLVHMWWPGDGYETIRYRVSTSNMLAPYIEQNLVTEKNGVAMLPIREIIHGPTLHPDLTASSLQLLLRSEGYESIKVQGSAIPLRF